MNALVISNFEIHLMIKSEELIQQHILSLIKKSEKHF